MSRPPGGPSPPARAQGSGARVQIVEELRRRRWQRRPRASLQEAPPLSQGVARLHGLQQRAALQLPDPLRDRLRPGLEHPAVLRREVGPREHNVQIGQDGQALASGQGGRTIPIGLSQAPGPERREPDGPKPVVAAQELEIVRAAPTRPPPGSPSRGAACARRRSRRTRRSARARRRDRGGPPPPSRGSGRPRAARRWRARCPPRARARSSPASP